MSRFNAGDLALVINATQAQNIGRVVELVRFTREEVIVLQSGGVVANPNMLACWEITADSLHATSRLRPDGFTTAEAALPECNLMPLRDDFHPERKQSREVMA